MIHYQRYRYGTGLLQRRRCGQRLAQNFDIFDFSLTDDEMTQIATMNQHDTGTVSFNDINFVKHLIEAYG